MTIHSSLLGISETELRNMIWSLVPSWRDDGLEDFHFLSGGYSNANVVFTRRSADQGAQYVLRIPQRSQPYVNRVAESAWYQRLPASVGIRPVALDIPTGLMVSAWVDGELLVDVFADRFTESDLLVYLQTLHNALPAVAERYSVPALLSAFVGSGEQSRAVVDALPPALTQEQQPAQTVTCHNDLEPVEYSGDCGWLGNLGLGVCRAKRCPVRLGQPAPRFSAQCGVSAGSGEQLGSRFGD
jgi:hypothetical protein